MLLLPLETFCCVGVIFAILSEITIIAAIFFELFRVLLIKFPSNSLFLLGRRFL